MNPSLLDDAAIASYDGFPTVEPAVARNPTVWAATPIIEPRWLRIDTEGGDDDDEGDV